MEFGITKGVQLQGGMNNFVRYQSRFKGQFMSYRLFIREL